MKILFLGGNVSGSLYQWLFSQGEDVIYHAERIDPEFIMSMKPDLVISYNYPYILKKDVLDLFRRKPVNLHISYLPWNRGANPNVWSFLEGTPSGVTIHYIDEGIDTGDILLQREVKFEVEKETLRSSYDKLHLEIQTLFRDNWADIKNDLIRPEKQVQSGTLHYVKDSEVFMPAIREKGWDISIRELKQFYDRAREKIS